MAELKLEWLCIAVLCVGLSAGTFCKRSVETYEENISLQVCDGAYCVKVRRKTKAFFASSHCLQYAGSRLTGDDVVMRNCDGLIFPAINQSVTCKTSLCLMFDDPYSEEVKQGIYKDYLCCCNLVYCNKNPERDWSIRKVGSARTILAHNAFTQRGSQSRRVKATCAIASLGVAVRYAFSEVAPPASPNCSFAKCERV